MPFVDNSTYSEELLKKRKKYRKTTAIWGSVIFFLTLAIPFAYVFLFGCYNGYGGNKPVEFMQSWNWLRNIKYFDSAITTPFFNIFDNFWYYYFSYLFNDWILLSFDINF